MKYHIATKRDFGDQPFLVDGKWVSSGFVVCTSDVRCNAMPGGTWFQTIPQALRAIAVLRDCGGTASWLDKIDSDKFWSIMHGRPVRNGKYV